ncbi:hypothetical protein B1A99_19050 [Cohnella sp. CIP 111063]|jgi:Predicted nucleic acid-binding protein, contains PIN domain|uniref:hypothetical protein n=1 Tax=unclassified Cohnella TaxID=2636738 RepID=UPI000B8BF275|nr:MULTISPECIES: hypothetical protein [unclassified Cohnella]OXS56954.1 hypothetical protein B1A99_19050 [Cohnella sp. CIP 111063]PRX69800.1 hypothetical protein B0G52_112159 [Cohnella sp. SGD-V74]
MKIVDFNAPEFSGFEPEESILIDTGVLYAYFNPFDAYHTTVKNLFDTYVFSNEDVLFLFVNPTIVNEIVNLAQRALNQYLIAHPHESENFSQPDKEAVRDQIMHFVRDLVQEDVLLVLDGDKESVLQQISLTNHLGAADAVNISMASLYGISFMTVDTRLVNNMIRVGSEIETVKNLYFTKPRHRTYFT